jgi:hypothetical protein
MKACRLVKPTVAGLAAPRPIKGPPGFLTLQIGALSDLVHDGVGGRCGRGGGGRGRARCGTEALA